MSDQHNHEHHGGGHEMDSPPTRQLFNIVWGLGIITLLSIVTCVQLFNKQRDAMIADSLDAPSYRLADYQTKQNGLKTSNGTAELNDGGKVVIQEYVPLEVAKKKILTTPSLLQAPPPPPGWIHPDDIASGGSSAAAAPAPAQAPTEGAPAEGAPAGAPTEGAPAAEGAPSGAPAGSPAAEGAATGPTSAANPAAAGADSGAEKAPAP